MKHLPLLKTDASRKRQQRTINPHGRRNLLQGFVASLFALICALLSGCRSVPIADLTLTPQEKRPLYRVTVSDSDEAGLLAQRTGLEVVRMQGTDPLFVEKAGMVEQLRQLGYVAEPVAARETFQRAVRIQRKGREEALLETGVRLLRRELDYWVVQGSVSQMELLRAQKYRLMPLDREPHPRPVQIFVRERSDVQRVSELGVDIYAVIPMKESGFTVSGGAFDDQIDALKSRQFQVTVAPEETK